MRRGRHSRRPDIEDGPEVADLGRGSVIRFGEQRFRISDTAMLGNIEVSFQRHKAPDDWEITLTVNDQPLMGDWPAPLPLPTWISSEIEATDDQRASPR